MKTLRFIALALFCSSSLLASPTGLEELREMRAYQLEALGQLDKESGFLPSRTAIEKLIEVETMLKLYSRLSDATLASSGRGGMSFGSRVTASDHIATHLELLQHYQKSYLAAARRSIESLGR